MWWSRKSSELYKVLLADSDSGDDEGSLSEHDAPKPGILTRRTLLLIILLTLSCASNLVFFAIVIFPGSKDGIRLLQDISGISGQKVSLFSPADVAVEYQTKLFQNGFSYKKTPYQEDPSPEVDQLWRHLYYNVSILSIPQADAKRIPNKTVPYPGVEGHYAANLAVFHQLHCLNSIRIALHKDHYEPQFPKKFHPSTGPYGKKHITHCIEALREALMCASDTSVLVWKWHAGSHASMGHSDVLHTCRNFEKIWEWGWEHRTPVPFDNRAYVPSKLDG